MAASKKKKKTKKEEEVVQREFTFEVNSDCPYKEENCGVRLPCLSCTYDFFIEIKDYKNADKLYVQFEKYVKDNVTRHEVLFDDLQREIVKDPPTDTQLLLIKTLSGEEIVPKSKEDAKLLIDQLRKGKK